MGEHQAHMIPEKLYIELNRQFAPLPEGDPENIAFQSYTDVFRESSLLWEDLLKTRIVIVLGETGCGKTKEFEKKANSMREVGQYAFFVRLEHLVVLPLAKIWSTEENVLFQRWLQSDNDGIFFLDSVDESKLRHSRDFVQAITSFEQGIGGKNLRRVRLIISSRITDWKHYEDAEELFKRFISEEEETEAESDISDSQFAFKQVRTYAQRIFVKNRSNNKNSVSEITEEISVVQMLPLDRERVRTYVEGKNATDADAFIKELDTNHAWEFARRPLDVDDLLIFWQENDRLGALTELIEFSLEKKLQPSPRDKEDPLSIEEARIGAQCLATATQLCRKLNFLIPEAQEDTTTAGAMAPLACLPKEWISMKVRALVGRPLFDVASLGRIRFHHGRYTEYLTAQWLEARMDNECPYPELENILFDQQEDTWVIRRGMKPVVAWLASGEAYWKKNIQQRILRVAPDLFLSFGDPKNLSKEYRRDLLQAILAHFQGRDGAWLDPPVEGLSRFADPGLAPDIAQIVLDRTASQGVRQTLLNLIQHGNLLECQEALLQIVASPEESDNIKIYALAAVRDIGNIETRRRLAEIVDTWRSLSNKICGLVCEALYPSVISAQRLVVLLRKSQAIGSNPTGTPFYLEYHFKENLTHEQAPKLLRELMHLAQEPPGIIIDTEETSVSSRYAWLRQVIPIVAIKAIEVQNLSKDEVGFLGEVIWFLGQPKERDFIPSSSFKELQECIKNCQQVRRAFVWYSIDKLGKTNNDDKARLYEIFRHEDLLSEREEDIEWLVKDILREATPKRQQQALRLAVDLWYYMNRKPSIHYNINRAVASDRELMRLFRVWAPDGPWTKTKLVVNRIRDYFPHRFNRDLNKTKRQMRNLKKRVRVKIWFLQHLRGLRNGKEWNALSQLAMEATERRDKWGASSWQPLVGKWGRRIAKATRDGWLISWREFCPQLPHERSNPNEVDRRISIGLSGINVALAENQLSFSKVSAEDARRMTRYAVNEMNGFPGWITELSRFQPSAVRDVLEECVQGEFDSLEERGQAHEVLARLRYGEKDLASLTRDVLIHKLQERDPHNTHVLIQALSILTNVENAPFGELAVIAAERAPYSEDNEIRHRLWTAVWLGTDADAAISYLESFLAHASEPVKRMEQLCAGLSGRSFEKLSEPSNPDYTKVDNLSRLISLVFSHVRPKDDINRVGGGTYTPEARDKAQDFRDWLLRALAENENPEALNYLHSFAEDPLFSSHRDWILHLIDKRTENSEDWLPWQPKDIVDFMQFHEIDPKTDRDLFRMVCKRFEDIKHNVEKGEDSPRKDLRANDNEIELRRWLTRQLRGRAKGYTVSPEVEIDRGEKPDLRIEAPGMPSVSIEIKWAQNETGPSLRKGLVNQLVGQYLRDPKSSKYGLYILGLHEGKGNWEPEEGEKLNFEEMLVYLNGVAASLVRESGDIGDLTIFGIDFRKPER